MATTNDLKNGLVLNLDGELWAVVEFQHVKPGKGGAFVRTTLKNVLSGKVVDTTFNAGTKVETATVDKRTMQYLYTDGDDYVFMDLESFDQITVSAAARSARRRTTCCPRPRRRRHPRGRAALHRAADPGRAGGHLHRAGPAGRPLHRRQQAGHRGDRRDRAGAAVHLPPARRSRSTPATAVTLAGLTGPDPASRARQATDAGASQGAASGPSTCSTRPTCGMSRRRRAGRATRPIEEPRPEHLGYAVALVEGVAEPPRPHRRADRQLRRGLDAGADAGRSTATWPGSRSTSCSTSTRSTTPVAISEAVELARRPVDRRLAALPQRRPGPHRRVRHVGRAVGWTSVERDAPSRTRIRSTICCSARGAAPYARPDRHPPCITRWIRAAGTAGPLVFVAQPALDSASPDSSACNWGRW